MEYKGIFYKSHYLVEFEIWINCNKIDTITHVRTQKQIEQQIASYKRDGYKVQLILIAPYTYKVIATF